MERVIELNTEDLEELKVVWKGINKGRAESKDIKARAINLWNKLGNKRYSTTTGCRICLADVHNSLKALYNKYYNK
tara:strand:+ start:14539 stop:14766 length:228 start_codon:yes stop_codon:yes gene_type:complete